MAHKFELGGSHNHIKCVFLVCDTMQFVDGYQCFGWTMVTI